METFIRDLRFGARMLVRNPRFSSLAVLMLALGIGANTLVFSTVDAWLVRPLPFREPNRLAAVWESEAKSPNTPSIFAPWRHYQEWKRQAESFEGLAGFFWRGYTLTGDGETESLLGQLVTEDYFSTLGIQAILGRTFEPDDLGGPPVVILGSGFWQRRFGAASDVIGATITLNDRTYSIVGVAPAGVSLPSVAQPDHPEDVWVLLRPDEPNPANKTYRETPDQPVGVVGRLKPGARVEQAQVELTAIKRRVDESSSPLWQNYSPFVANLQADATRSLRPTLLLLAGAVTFVLLIACINVAGLLLARMAERRKEMAVRAALGAGRRALVRQLLTESLLLSLIGAAAGLLLAQIGLRTFLSLNPFEIPAFNEVAINNRVLLFTILLSIATAMLFGVIPAFQAGRLDINELLKESSRSSSHGVRHQSARKLLVAFEVALSLILLTGAGLMTRSFARLVSEPRGFVPDNLVAAGINLPAKTYSDKSAQIRFYDRLLYRLQALPVVEGACVTTVLPVYSGGSDELAIEGRPAIDDNATPSAAQILVSSQYFSTVGIPIDRGRAFDDRDREDREPVAIVSETLVRQYFGGADPIGQRLKVGGAYSKSPWRKIVGVAGDTRVDSYGSLARNTKAMAYVPYAQTSDDNILARRGNVVVRITESHPELASVIGGEIRSLEPTLPLPELQIVNALLSRSIKQPRLQTLLSSSFAVVALLLAAIGLYGVISYTVIQRSHEIGIRVALGAQNRDVLKLVLCQGVSLTLAGIAIGLFASLALTRLIKSLLYGVSTSDPLTFIVIALLLIFVAFSACYLPARRATKVDPVVALRHE